MVAAADGSAALLGASASTAVTIMLEVLERCFAERPSSATWRERFSSCCPAGHGSDPADGSVLQSMRVRSNAELSTVEAYSPAPRRR